MVNPDLREYLGDIDPELIVYDNPSFDNSIIGTDGCGKAVYSFSKMIEELAQDDNISLEESMEFIDYNTVRATSYMGENAPIICYDIEV